MKPHQPPEPWPDPTPPELTRKGAVAQNAPPSGQPCIPPVVTLRIHAEGSDIREIEERFAREVGAARERAIAEELGSLFYSERFAVEVEKPRWMPGWIYRRLMKTIIYKKAQ